MGKLATFAVGLCLLLGAGQFASAAQLAIYEGDGVADGMGHFMFNAPLLPGDLIWFDIIVSDGLNESASAAGVRLSVTPVGHIGSLTLNTAASEAVATDAAYWLNGNSDGAAAMDHGGGAYSFGDSSMSGVDVAVASGARLARFAFTWDGVSGDYEVFVDDDMNNTFLFENFAKVAPDWTENPVTLYVPEPASVLALLTGAFIAWRRR